MESTFSHNYINRWVPWIRIWLLLLCSGRLLDQSIHTPNSMIPPSPAALWTYAPDSCICCYLFRSTEYRRKRCWGRTIGSWPVKRWNWFNCELRSIPTCRGRWRPSVPNSSGPAFDLLDRVDPEVEELDEVQADVLDFLDHVFVLVHGWHR